MCWVKRCAHWCIVVSGVFLILSIVAKLGPGALADASPRSLFALALIFAVYSIACSLCGAGSKSSGA